MRSFIDQDGVQWQVWKTIPQSGFSMDRRSSDRSSDSAEVEHERRSKQDRRRGDIRKGWLCFESTGERRRLFPIPEDWETCSTLDLEQLCRDALPARAPRVPSPPMGALEAQVSSSA